MLILTFGNVVIMFWNITIKLICYLLYGEIVLITNHIEDKKM